MWINDLSITKQGIFTPTNIYSDFTVFPKTRFENEAECPEKYSLSEIYPIDMYGTLSLTVTFHVPNTLHAIRVRQTLITQL